MAEEEGAVDDMRYAKWKGEYLKVVGPTDDDGVVPLRYISGSWIDCPIGLRKKVLTDVRFDDLPEPVQEELRSGRW